MALVGVELETLVFEPDALTTPGDNLPFSNRMNGWSDSVLLGLSKTGSLVATFH